MADKNKEINTWKLILRCRQGDRLAQFDLYKLYHKAMYNISLRLVSRSEVAEDIMQEAFLSAFTKISTFKGEVSFGAWIKKIVINKSIDYLRERKIKFEELETYKPENIENGTDDIYVSDDVDTDEKIREIKQAMLMLPDGYRVVLSLALFEGYDHEEIAQILSVSESTSRSQLARAKRKLIEILKINGKNETAE